jgi:hypothetical protein
MMIENLGTPNLSNQKKIPAEAAAPKLIDVTKLSTAVLLTIAYFVCPDFSNDNPAHLNAAVNSELLKRGILRRCTRYPGLNEANRKKIDPSTLDVLSQFFLEPDDTPEADFCEAVFGGKPDYLSICFSELHEATFREQFDGYECALAEAAAFLQDYAEKYEQSPAKTKLFLGSPALAKFQGELEKVRALKKPAAKVSAPKAVAKAV